MIHISHDLPFPDVTDGEPCCYGYAIHGPGRCTCWRPVHDLPQRKVKPAKPAVRARCCGDCAFRPDSPERNGVEGYQNNSQAEIDALVQGSATFFCHQGTRRIIAYEHEPTGATIDAPPADYDPPIMNNVPYKANGKPQDICAGLCAARKRIGR